LGWRNSLTAYPLKGCHPYEFMQTRMASFFIKNRNLKTNNQKSQKSEVKNSTDKSTESEKRRKLLAMQGKVKWEGDLNDMRGN
jgi:hypothetical protein